MTKQERIDLLKAMNIVMLSTNDKTCYEHWMSIGIPDVRSLDDFELIAKNNEEFKRVVNIFCNLVHDFF